MREFLVRQLKVTVPTHEKSTSKTHVKMLNSWLRKLAVQMIMHTPMADCCVAYTLS